MLTISHSRIYPGLLDIQLEIYTGCIDLPHLVCSISPPPYKKLLSEPAQDNSSYLYKMQLLELFGWLGDEIEMQMQKQFPVLNLHLSWKTNLFGYHPMDIECMALNI